MNKGIIKMQIAKTLKSLESISNRLTSVIGKACDKTRFTKSIFDDCNNAQKVFIDAHKLSRLNGNNQVKSLTKGVSAFAKEVGPIPFTTTVAGFCLLPIGGTSIGLVTGLIARKGLKKLF